MSCFLSNSSSFCPTHPSLMRNRNGLYSEADVMPMREKNVLDASGLDDARPLSLLGDTERADGPTRALVRRHRPVEHVLPAVTAAKCLAAASTCVFPHAAEVREASAFNLNPWQVLLVSRPTTQASEAWSRM